ncbi:DUF502 domain-containing protein [Methylovirgula sp. HY1]|uniref:DUF502 domain-containing protein n=1 Tax=Methylovirgula sp. HY1 TaxID=2822761 RepID=UPI001C5B2F5E|nr:DUF502 domain-containing protein [Methylovirgula sp. HY1]QXX74436.1 hypothetical protein MHY1_01248 [Methylovirgula sp. HY1]
MTEAYGAPSPQPPADPPVPPRGPGIGGRIRNWFLTGIVVAGPLAITLYLVLWFVDTVDNWVKRIIPVKFWPDAYLPFPLPGFGVIFAFLGLTFLGFLAANLAGRSLIALGEAILDRMPIIRSIYKSMKQIFETIFSRNGTSFRKVGLIEFPGNGMWSLVFISAPPPDKISASLPLPEDHLSVFLPCTPNPTTGFYFFLPARDVIEVALSPDEAAKLIMSCGVIQPEGQTSPALAEAVRQAKALEEDAA